MTTSDSEEIKNSIYRFNEMLKTNFVYFFDVKEFQNISEYYLSIGEIQLSKKAISMGLSQHPNNLDLLLDIPGRRGIRVEYKYSEPLYAPITKGDIVGSMEIVVPGRENIEINLLAGENINKVNFFSGFIKSFDYFLYKDE